MCAVQSTTAPTTTIVAEAAATAVAKATAGAHRATVNIAYTHIYVNKWANAKPGELQVHKNGDNILMVEMRLALDILTWM